MPKLIISVVTAIAVLVAGALSASALVAQDGDDPVAVVAIEPDHPQPVPVDPVPLPFGSVHLIGEVWANGHNIGEVHFGLIWSEEDPSHAQLWALLNDVPTPVCVGRIFDDPSGEPIFFGSTSLMEPAGTCHMARLPDHSAVSLFAASNDGQWASSIMKWAGSVDPVPIFD